MTNPPTAHFESFGGKAEGWNVSFRDARSTSVARSLDEVVPLLREAESASRRGAWVALAISYDAAPAFDHALEVRRAPDFPLAWSAVFDDASSIRAEFEDASPIRGESNAALDRVDSHNGFSISALEPALSTAEYVRAITAIKSYIAAGDTYQVNYTFPLHGRLSGNPYDCFRTVAESQGAGYSAYLDIGSHRILSFSPELFFRRSGNKLTTRPMKGTAPRGRWPAEDAERAAQLAASAKDRAENVMIVDLLRNDLGRIAVVGSVKVPELFSVERFNRVLQMTSTVTAMQRPDTSLVDILSALFPCGSVTGAPKVRSMAIIRELEPHPRGIYTGAIGLLSPSGDMVFNVAIRTLVVTPDGAAVLGVGGGITWESTIEGEYEECLLKASFLTDRWPRFALLETLLLADGEYTLLERHLSRANSSAGYFGFEWNERRVRRALDTVRESHPDGRWKVRLVIDRNSEPASEVSSLADARDTPLCVKIAKRPVDETDPLLFHKITHRARYDTALAECQPCDDVIFWNARGEITESTIANVVLSSGGKNWTPPREAGLLAGTFRDELVSRGELFERTITREELERAGSFSLVNSVRGWMTANLMTD